MQDQNHQHQHQHQHQDQSNNLTELNLNQFLWQQLNQQAQHQQQHHHQQQYQHSPLSLSAPSQSQLPSLLSASTGTKKRKISAPHQQPHTSSTPAVSRSISLPANNNQYNPLFLLEQQQQIQQQQLQQQQPSISAALNALTAAATNALKTNTNQQQQQLQYSDDINNSINASNPISMGLNSRITTGLLSILDRLIELSAGHSALLIDNEPNLLNSNSLTAIRLKLFNEQYNTVELFVRDLRQLFINIIQSYNDPGLLACVELFNAILVYDPLTMELPILQIPTEPITSNIQHQQPPPPPPLQQQQQQPVQSIISPILLTTAAPTVRAYSSSPAATKKSKQNKKQHQQSSNKSKKVIRTPPSLPLSFTVVNNDHQNEPNIINLNLPISAPVAVVNNNNNNNTIFNITPQPQPSTDINSSSITANNSNININPSTVSIQLSPHIPLTVESILKRIELIEPGFTIWTGGHPRHTTTTIANLNFYRL